MILSAGSSLKHLSLENAVSLYPSGTWKKSPYCCRFFLFSVKSRASLCIIIINSSAINCLYSPWNNSFFFFFHFLGLHSQHVEVPRLRVESELQLPAFPTATATLDPSHVCNLHHSPQQPRILNPLSKTRDWTHILMVPSRVHFHWATKGTPKQLMLKRIFISSSGAR